MPNRTKRVKRETSLAKVSNGRLKAIEPAARGSAEDVTDASLVRTTPSANGEGINSRRQARPRVTAPYFVPVQDATGAPLMPCHPARARELVRAGKAVRRFNRGIFYIRLTERVGGDKQEIAVGIDPGSKREAYTVKSETHTYLNIQASAVDWVSKAVEVRRNMRRARRFRKTPCRANRLNRSRGELPPSTKARWQWKLSVCAWLSRLYPVTHFVVEDVAAKTRPGKRRWNASFSPLEVGKKWFYDHLGALGEVTTRKGYETKELRDAAGLKKSKSKLAERFDAHCVDSWVLANWCVGGHVVPDTERMILIAPIRLHRQQLHRLEPAAGGTRRRYGSTRSCGFKRGGLAIHQKHGLCYVGGTTGGRISLHSISDGKRVCKNAKPSETKQLTHNTWRTRLLCATNDAVSVANIG